MEDEACRAPRPLSWSVPLPVEQTLSSIASLQVLLRARPLNISWCSWQHCRIIWRNWPQMREQWKTLDKNHPLLVALQQKKCLYEYHMILKIKHRFTKCKSKYVLLWSNGTSNELRCGFIKIGAKKTNILNFWHVANENILCSFALLFNLFQHNT